MESLILFLPFLLIMGGFMYFASRRQRRAMQATIELHESLRPGDRVHTTSGLQATVVGLTDDTVDLEIAPGVVTTWMKLAIRDRILPDDEDDLVDCDDSAGEARSARIPDGHPAPNAAPADRSRNRRAAAT
ncbi:preprotein translocase subunit YajC [Mycobacterium avium 11-0986]|nr:preprotein translocase subunit YajC [Mycobacterium avium 11-0986]